MPMNIPESYLQQRPDTRNVEVLIPDINGVLRGKRLPADQLPKVYRDELMIPRATVLLDTFGVASDNIPYGFQDGDPDRAVRPVESTLTSVPWQETATAQVLAEIADGDGLWFGNPAEVLRRCMHAFSELRLTPVIAIELEFHLLHANTDNPSPLQGKPDLPTFTGPQTYNLELLADHAAFLTEVEHACAVQNISLGGALAEYGEGQFEINLRHTDDIVRACHEACLLRRLVRCIALKHRSIATFMAKPLAGHPGNGMHVHISLLDESGTNVLAGDNEGLTDVMQHAISGLLQWMPDSMAVFAPNANSYQRLDPDTFAPVQADWGIDHRAVAIRLPQASKQNTRIEHRVAGADACPYLVVAVMLSAIKNGIEQRLPLPAPTAGTTVSADALVLPNRWHSALERFDRADKLKNALGAEFSQLYHQVKVDEEIAWHRQLNRFDHLAYLRTL